MRGPATNPPGWSECWRRERREERELFAGAELTCSGWWWPPANWMYLCGCSRWPVRWCGADLGRPATFSRTLGSSLRVQSGQGRTRHPARDHRFIPACAGRRLAAPGRVAWRTAHLCVCGVDYEYAAENCPPARCISACAEQPLAGISIWRAAAACLCVCGVAQARPTSSRAVVGTSLRARGGRICSCRSAGARGASLCCGAGIL